jgi:hypothetical protein
MGIEGQEASEHMRGVEEADAKGQPFLHMCADAPFSDPLLYTRASVVCD